MPSLRTARVVSLLTGAALAATLTATVGVGSSPSRPDRVTGGVDLVDYPTNAGKIFRWGDAQWADDFVGPTKRMWHQNRPRLIRDQHGMLTINGTRHSGSVAATLRHHGRTHGRWEARVRAEQYTRRHTPYKVVWELIPTGAYRCGARNIVLAQYELGSHRAHAYVRNGSRTFAASKKRDLSAGPFHTYAVEVTRRHVSWFVDTHVIRTERRPAATTGVEYRVRFRLLATKGRRMNPGRMQMDWVRYYSLHRENARSIDAPRMHLTTHHRHRC